MLVGADGAHSVIRAAVGGHSSGPTAIAVRGYAPTHPRSAGVQSIVFDAVHQPAYAWSFDRGDGLANVGYGAVLKPGRAKPSRAHLLERLDALLPGSTTGATGWKGHHLPLSGRGWRPRTGRILLAGDAASLVNPLTGEGIYYAVATGLAAGASAAEAIAARDPGSAGARYRGRTRGIGRQLRHTAAAAALCRSGVVLNAGLRASAADQRVFDDLVELGLAQGHITATMLRGLVGAHRHPATQAHPEETTACES